MYSFLKAIPVAASLLLASSAWADDILIAVASNFTAPMAELVERFEQDSGHSVEVAFGSSGRFFAQISNGAPFQLFFSADQEKPIELEKSGLALADTRFTYAIGRLVLWSSDEELLRENTEALYGTGFNRLALANPRLAPYGQAALEVLQELNLVERTQQRWVLGENIAQTFQFVETGNADLGFVALSQVSQRGEIHRGSGWVMPGNLYTPIRQDVVLLKRGEFCQACRELLSFVQSIQSRQVIESYGYRVN